MEGETIEQEQQPHEEVMASPPAASEPAPVADVPVDPVDAPEAEPQAEVEAEAEAEAEPEPQQQPEEEEQQEEQQEQPAEAKQASEDEMDDESEDHGSVVEHEDIPAPSVTPPGATRKRTATEQQAAIERLSTPRRSVGSNSADVARQTLSSPRPTSSSRPYHPRAGSTLYTPTKASQTRLEESKKLIEHARTMSESRQGWRGAGGKVDHKKLFKTSDTEYTLQPNAYYESKLLDEKRARAQAVVSGNITLPRWSPAASLGRSHITECRSPRASPLKDGQMGETLKVTQAKFSPDVYKSTHRVTMARRLFDESGSLSETPTSPPPRSPPPAMLPSSPAPERPTTPAHRRYSSFAALQDHSDAFPWATHPSQ